MTKISAFDEAYCLETFKKLLAVDSTTGQYEELQTLLCSVTPPFKLPPMFAEGANDAQIGMDR